MKTTWRSWRVILLAWAVLLAPQLSFVHALSHIAAATASIDERQQAPDKVCDTCFALAQVGAALPSSHVWRAPQAAWPEPVATLPRATSPRHTAYFLARAPPPALI